jgi:hypothetical protein
MITITFDLANKGQPMNWCFIILTQLVVELTRWTKRQKKATKPMSSKTKGNKCYLGLLLDVLFRKWFPLFEMPLPRTNNP